MKTSGLIKQRLEDKGMRYWAGDNISEVLEEGDKIVFVAEPDLGSFLTDLAATVSYLEV